MPFIEHFELLNLIHFDKVETWLTRESGSGRKLLLHRYPKTSGLRERLQLMPLDELGMILKAGEDGDYFFVVTQDTPDFRRFLNWVDRLSMPQTPAEAAVPKPDEAAEPGEFTSTFQAPKNPSSHPETPVHSTAQTEAPGPPKPPTEPSEFTQMFRTPTKPSPPPTVPVAEKQGQKITPEPGEFTQMFKGPAVPPQRAVPAVSPVPPAGGQEPGEFTRLFNSPLPQTLPATSPAGAGTAPVLREALQRTEKPQAKAQPPAPISEPGEFTQMFRQPSPSPPARDARSNPIAAPQSAAEPGELTRMFKGPAVPPQRPVPATPPLLPVGGQQPSEFTKLFNNPLPETRLAERLEKPQAEAKPAAPFSEPGDFTKIFGRPNQNLSEREVTANPIAAARAQDLGGVTGIFSKKDAFENATPQVPMAAGPSDYTRILQSGNRPVAGAVSSPAPVQAEQKPVAPSQPAAKKQTQSAALGLVITLAVIAVVAIALILYFVMKR